MPSPGTRCTASEGCHQPRLGGDEERFSLSYSSHSIMLLAWMEVLRDYCTQVRCSPQLGVFSPTVTKISLGEDTRRR